MAYCGQPTLVDYLNFSTSPEAPFKAAVCAFTQGGAGVPPVMFSLFVFGGLGMALAYRVRHPSPLIVAAMLTAGIAVINTPASAVNIFALVLFAGISIGGLYLLARAQSSL